MAIIRGIIKRRGFLVRVVANGEGRALAEGVSASKDIWNIVRFAIEVPISANRVCAVWMGQVFIGGVDIARKELMAWR